MARRLLYLAAMRMYLCAVVVVGACGFSPSADVVQMDAQQAGSDTPGGGSAGSGNPTPRLCHVADPGLQLCIDFDELQLEPSVADLSANSHVGMTTDVNHTMRDSENAASFDYDSDLHIAESPDLNISNNLTYETWINLRGYTDAWPIDNYGEYAIHILDNHVRCFANGYYADAPAALATDTWHHLACTYGDGMFKVYVDGARVGCVPVTGTIGNVNHGGIELGQSLNGELDDIHIFSKVLDNAAIAAHIGINAIAEPADSQPYQGPPS